MRQNTKTFLTAAGLSLGAAISLGLSRFSYALLLPSMRDDLGWSYTLAGGMNTANAFGYLAGALITPALIRQFNVRSVLIAGAILASLFMLLSGFVVDPGLLLGQRFLAGVASAFTFICGGLLAARLGAQHGRQMGLLLGIYYGGTGLGIVLSAQFIPYALRYASQAGRLHAWQPAWIVLAALCLLLTTALAKSATAIDVKASAPAAATDFRLADFGFGLVGYGLFGVGYIGYMTFIVAFLREQGMANTTITAFYTLLGIGVCMSSFLWARLLDRYQGGQAIAILNLLISLATAIPLLSHATVPLFISGLLFGSVFLSVVAASTALVRHNLPASSWPAGISAFTTVFALGQIVGPSVTGWISDSQGGLEHGFIFSAATLLAGALIASRQRHLPKHPQKHPRQQALH